MMRRGDVWKPLKEKGGSHMVPYIALVDSMKFSGGRWGTLYKELKEGSRSNWAVLPQPLEA